MCSPQFLILRSSFSGLCSIHHCLFPCSCSLWGSFALYGSEDVPSDFRLWMWVSVKSNKWRKPLMLYYDITGLTFRANLHMLTNYMLLFAKELLQNWDCLMTVGWCQRQPRYCLTCRVLKQRFQVVKFVAVREWRVWAIPVNEDAPPWKRF